MLRGMAGDLLHPPTQDNDPLLVGELFRLHRTRCGQQLEAACHLLTHDLGWEIRLDVAGSVQRAEVCRSQDTALETSAQWKTAMIEQGWA